MNHITQAIADIIKRNPSFIVIEDLNVQGLMKNKHLSKSIASQKWGYFRINLMINVLNIISNSALLIDGTHLLKLAHTVGKEKRPYLKKIGSLNADIVI